MADDVRLLGPAEVRDLADRLQLRPTKQRGQNFVIDPNTVRRIVRLAGVDTEDTVLEVGPGLGSLTLALLPATQHVTAVEIDPALAGALPGTIADRAPTMVDRLSVVTADALRLEEVPGPPPTAMVANLPYNVAVPVLLRMWDLVPTLRRTLVMVQAEVAERLAAGPGGKVYGVPSVKARWYGDVRRVGSVGRSVFWPAPRVDSGLVRVDHHSPPSDVERDAVFAVVDAAFAQRRKSLRAALAGWAGSPAAAEDVLREAGVAPSARGEQLGLAEFMVLAKLRPAIGSMS